MRSRVCRVRRITIQSILAMVWVLFAWSLPSYGQEGVRIELNKLEPLETACRAYLLFENRTSGDFQSLKLDLVMFDSEGIINRRLAVEGGPLPAGKTSVKLFDIDGISCDAVHRVLLNAALTCNGAEGERERENCLRMIETSSRTGAEFFK